MDSPTISTIQSVLEDHRVHLQKKLNELTNDEINWTPQRNKNSIAVLIEHITGSEAYWIQEIIMGQKINRVRDKEFEDRYRSNKELSTAYEYMKKSTKEILSHQLSDQHLFNQINVRGTSRTILWVLLHVVEHNYYHIGQINYITGLLKGDSFLERPKNPLKTKHELL